MKFYCHKNIIRMLILHFRCSYLNIFNLTEIQMSNKRSKQICSWKKKYKRFCQFFLEDIITERLLKAILAIFLWKLLQTVYFSFEAKQISFSLQLKLFGSIDTLRINWKKTLAKKNTQTTFHLTLSKYFWKKIYFARFVKNFAITSKCFTSC